ncbi:MAG: hypothetical protein J6S14_15140 [Clostridia bacterium]|nr:hypothetical protein [Clostridia bacterium]
MEIIKPGDPEALKEIKYFVCNRCGCEWKADNSEYELWSNQLEGTFYTMECPCCKTVVFKSIYDHN